jgi:hypothetical protein
MKTLYEARSVPALHTIYLRLSGLLREEDIRAFFERYRTLTDAYKGRKHFILADLRGMAPASPEAARLMGEAIGYGRAHGVACCAHVSDAAVARLQSLRLAREATVGDDVTVDAASLAEAERILDEARQRLYPSSKKAG